MPTLLKIDASPRGDYSISRKFSTTFAEEWQKTHSGTVVVRDLHQTKLPFVDLPWIAGAYSTPDQHTPEQKAALKVSDDLIAELFAADHVVIATPMYNFSVPAILKAYIDHIVRINKTFTSNFEGLVKGKKLTVLIASGGDYSPASGRDAYNMESPYLKAIFGFIGIIDTTIVYAGGTAAIDMGKISREEFIVPFQEPVLAAAK